MPKYGIHYIVLQETQRKLQEAPPGSLARQRGELLAANPFHANLGAIGPDLFFYALDYKVMQLLEPFHSAYHRLQSVYDQITAPVEALEEALEEAVEDTLDQLEQLPVVGTHIAEIRALLDQIEDLDRLLGAVTDEVFKAGVVRLLGLDAHDPNYGVLPRSLYQTIFQPGSQAGLEEPDWYWFDMLHYRRTGQFARNLLQEADDEPLQSYALAYLSHIATDTVGHPYVNLICGAPYRIAVQRHVTAENYMDQWKWRQTFDGENIRATLYDHYGFEPFATMPEPLAKMLQKALMATYGNVSHPLRLKRTDLHPSATAGFSEGFLTVEEIQKSYELLRTTLQMLGKNRDLRPQEPYDGADEDLAQLNESLDIFDPPPPLAPPPLPDCDWEDIWGSAAGECFEAFVDELQIWAGMIRDLIDWAVESGRKALNLIEDSINNPQPGTPTRWLQLLLYMWQLQAYTAYRALNAILAQAGLVYPEPDEAQLTVPLARSLITPSLCWEGKKGQGYPRLRPPGQSHLICPDCAGEGCGQLDSYLRRHNTQICCEQPTTTPAFYPRTSDTTPDVFIQQTPFDADAVQAYARAATPQETHTLHAQGREIGNAIDFTTWLIENALNPAADDLQAAVFCDWNLDGDRGYAYKAWEGLPPICHIEGIELAFKFYGTEFARYFPRVWPDATNRYAPPEGDVRYVDDKRVEACILTSFNLSEDAIPDVFRRLDANLTPADWTALVPDRLCLTGNDFLQNVRFVNGVQTNHYVAVHDMHHLRLTLQAAMDDQSVSGSAAAALVHNRTQGFLGDFIEATPDKLHAHRLWLYHQNPLGTPPPIPNSTTIGIIALLHQAMLDDRPVMLVGYSQGTLITGNAIMCFKEMGTAQTDFLKEKVKLLHLAVVLDPVVRAYLKTLLDDNHYLGYTNSNAGDPLTFTLAQPADSISTNDADLLLNPRFSPDYWLEVRRRVANAAGGFLQAVHNMVQNSTTCELFDPHMMQNYLVMLLDDVQNDGVVDGVNVRDFLFA